MDYDRAQSILQSKDTIRVKWRGEDVWIDSVDPYSQVAAVHLQQDPGVSKNVPIAELEEYGSAAPQ
jgi:H-type small acid-soluble spore protein